MKIGICYSGGVESYLLYKLAKLQYPEAEIVCVYFDIGTGYAKNEISKLPDFVQVRKLDWYNGETTFLEKKTSDAGPIMIPGRNLIFASMLTMQFLPDKVWMGPLINETHFTGTDKNYVFRDLVNGLHGYILGVYDVPQTVLEFPFADMGFDKPAAMQHGIDNGTTLAEIEAHTWSCHDPVADVPCGKCSGCKERKAAFASFT